MATQFPGVALVTGAASGIGRATALAFASAGCPKIALSDRNHEGLLETKTAIEQLSASETCVIQTDLLDENQIVRMVEATVRLWGRVDYAVNAAGILGNNAPSTETSLAQFDLITNINYRGAWLCSRAEIGQMQKQEPLEGKSVRGAVVNIASQLGLVGRRDAPAYCASKAAVIAMTKCDAIDYAQHNIRINCVCPGVIATPMTQSDPSFAAALGPAIAMAPMNRMGTAEEVAAACLWLCGDGAGFVCGHALVVDGGYTIN
ncbi:hypothetical protein HYFRA_00001303 [Hymenoscyphus fraxineus]|uniref:NAD(P)-binding protein n=1 Tax=Hymenoscyphus fraxineus TaxID=746836 RepID=A0A9N9PXJ6_9HELO|nr:hypothetical protein HYFRA_00001303 [Hymenoscyphus fraxineus]